MPQTDLLSFPSTVFFLLLCFLGGYAVWISFFVPSIIAVSKVRGLISDITFANSEVLLNSYQLNIFKKLDNLDVESKTKFYKQGLLLSPFFFAPLDELILIFNFFLLIIFFYSILRNFVVTSVENTSLESQKPIKQSLEFNMNSNDMEKYSYFSDSIVAESSYLLKRNLSQWDSKRDQFIFAPAVYALSLSTVEVLNDRFAATSYEKNKKLFNNYTHIASRLKSTFNLNV